MKTPNRIQELLADVRRHDSVFWRSAIRAGVTHGPEAFIRYSPPLFGLAFGAALAPQRRAVLRNLRRVLGRRSPLAEYADVARVFSNYASCLTEGFIAGSGHGANVVARCTGDENYAAAAREGRGVVIVTAHTGGWQLAGSVLHGGHDAEVVMVMQRERDVRAQALQERAQEHEGVRAVYLGDDPLAALPLLAHLRRGGVVAAQVDRQPKGMRGRRVTLFGEPWTVPEGPLLLAALTGAPIVPAFARRLWYMHYEIVVEPAIHVPKKPSKAQLDAAAGSVAAAMERFLRENPTQWFHFE